jgi:hypothetical protein
VRLGHKTAAGFLALAAGKRFDERAAEGEWTLFLVDRPELREWWTAAAIIGRTSPAPTVLCSPRPVTTGCHRLPPAVATTSV